MTTIGENQAAERVCPAHADPVCDLSPHHDRVVAAVERAERASSGPLRLDANERPLLFRTPRNSTNLGPGA